MDQHTRPPNPLPVNGDDETASFSEIRINTATASIARAYDYVLGGKDNFAVDRDVGEKFLQVPGAKHLPWDNRAWLRRITRYLVGQAGIRQIIDLGSGLPTTSSIHTFAQEITDGVQVVYVDNDPMVLAHGRALLSAENTTTVITGDVGDPAAILADPDLTALIDLDQPFALLLASVLHHVPSPADQDIAAALRAQLRPGCYLAVANFHDPGDERAPAIEHALLEGGLGSGWVRPYPQHRRYIGDLDLIAPGLGPVNEWQPDEHTPTDSPAHHLYIGALAHRTT